MPRKERTTKKRRRRYFTDEQGNPLSVWQIITSYRVIYFISLPLLGVLCYQYPRELWYLVTDTMTSILEQIN